MIYGRVIGNELRDVPPECLPIWGQRWSGYRAPHGPSPFSTRIFSVDRMCEVGPALTSPTQFEAMLTEEDEGEDTGSEPGQLYSSFPSSPLAVQPAQWIPSPKTPTPRSVYRGSSHSPRSSKIHHQSTRHSTPQNSACLGTTFLSGQRSKQPHTHLHASEPLFQPSTIDHGTTPQGGYGPFENDHTFWDMDQTLTSIQPGADPSLGNHVLGGQLHYTMPLHSILEGQFAADDHTKSSADPFHPNPLPCLGDGYHLQPSQADGQNRFIAMSPSTHHFVPLLEQNVSSGSSWSHDLGTTIAPCIAHHPDSMISQWSASWAPSHPSSPGPLQNSVLPLSLEVFHSSSQRSSSSRGYTPQ